MPSERIQRSMMKLMRPWIGTCEQTQACLSDHLDATLPDADEKRVRRHLAWCKRCQALFASLSRVVESVHALGHDDQRPAPSVADAVTERLRRELG
jgi:anti-sigma factor RsiW